MNDSSSTKCFRKPKTIYLKIDHDLRNQKQIYKNKHA